MCTKYLPSKLHPDRVQFLLALPAGARLALRHLSGVFRFRGPGKGAGWSTCEGVWSTCKKVEVPAMVLEYLEEGYLEEVLEYLEEGGLEYLGEGGWNT